jgi:hypothetical protein
MTASAFNRSKRVDLKAVADDDDSSKLQLPSALHRYQSLAIQHTMIIAAAAAARV